VADLRHFANVAFNNQRVRTWAAGLAKNLVISGFAVGTRWLSGKPKWTPTSQHLSQFRGSSTVFNPSKVLTQPTRGLSTLTVPNSLRTRMSRRRRRSGFKRRYTKNPSTTARLALSKVRKLEKKRDVKMWDSNGVIMAVTVVGDIRSLADIAQGDAFNKRDGDHVFPFRLKVNAQWTGQTLATIEIYRTIIFIDKLQVSAAIPAVLDVLSDSSPLSMLRASTRTRFKILFDQTYTGTSDSLSRQSYVALVDVRLSMKLSFAGTGATSWNKNGIFMLNISNTSGNDPDIYFRTRLLYND